VRRPYEEFGWSQQEAMLEAAAIALHLAGTGAITARGTLGPLLAREPHRPVYDGDPPSTPDPADPTRSWERAEEEARAAIHQTLHRSWEQAQQDLEAWFQAARTDPAATRQILGVLTHYSQTRRTTTGNATP
jgi:hypothetical protein